MKIITLVCNVEDLTEENCNELTNEIINIMTKLKIDEYDLSCTRTINQRGI